MKLLGERNWYLPRQLQLAAEVRAREGTGARRVPKLPRHANRRTHRGRRLPRAQCGHPGHLPQGHQRSRARVRRLPVWLGGSAEQRGDRPDALDDARDPAPRRDDPRVVPHEPVQGRRRRRSGAGGDEGAQPGRADPDRRRGHARGRGQAARGRDQRRGRAQDDRQRPRRDRLHVRLPDGGADRHRRHRPAPHNRRVPQPRDHRRGDGPPRGLDRRLLGDGRRRRRDPDPGAAVQHRPRVRAHPAPPQGRLDVLDRRRRRGRDA